MMRLAVIAAIFAPFLLVAYTGWVWQSAFDQGADVALCLIASYQQTGHEPVKVAASDPNCRRAKDYEGNPLWQLRRRRHP